MIPFDPNRCNTPCNSSASVLLPLTRYTPLVGAWRSLVARVLWEH